MTPEKQWEELKSIIEEGDVQPYTNYDPEFSIDYCKGFDAALVWVENQIKELEKKKMIDIEDRLTTVPSLVDEFICGEGTIDDLQDAVEILEDTIKEFERCSHLTRAELEKEWDEKYLPPWIGLKWKDS